MSLAIVSIGLVAAIVTEVTYGDPVFGDIDGNSHPVPPGAIDSPPVDTGDDGIDGDVGPRVPGGINLVICYPILQHPLAILGIVGGVSVTLFGIYRRYNGATAGLFGTGIIPIVLLVYFLLINCPSSAGGSGSGVWNVDSQAVFTNTTPLIDWVPTVPPSMLVFLLTGVMFVAVATLVSVTKTDEHATAFDEESPESDASAFARAAGRAADRIERANVPVDNAVYRAWLEMTELLTIENPKTTTPMDFAEAAIDTDLDAGDVHGLTALFTAVRYGGEHVDDASEDRAITVLRRIERAYRRGDDEMDGSSN